MPDGSGPRLQVVWCTMVQHRTTCVALHVLFAKSHLSEVYANALLVTLNSRKGMRDFAAPKIASKFSKVSLNLRLDLLSGLEASNPDLRTSVVRVVAPGVAAEQPVDKRDLTSQV